MLKKAHPIHVTSEVRTQFVISETDQETLKLNIIARLRTASVNDSASGAKSMEGTSAKLVVQMFSSMISIIEQF